MSTTQIWVSSNLKNKKKEWCRCGCLVEMENVDILLDFWYKYSFPRDVLQFSFSLLTHTPQKSRIILWTYKLWFEAVSLLNFCSAIYTVGYFKMPGTQSKANFIVLMFPRFSWQDTSTEKDRGYQTQWPEVKC